MISCCLILNFALDKTRILLTQNISEDKVDVM